MTVASLILVEPALPGNLGAAMRVAANFSVSRIDLVRPSVDPRDDEVLSWACGADQRLECRIWEDLADAAHGYRTLVASASGRGRHNLPVLSPREAIPSLISRGLEGTALVFGNESRGLRKEDLDICDLVMRVPTDPDFPVLNLAQAIAILVSQVHSASRETADQGLEPAPHEAVEGLMQHLEASLLTIGYLDPKNPQRILRKLRRLFGRAGVTANEVDILRGVCRQMEWAAGTRPARFSADDDSPPEE